jgi:small subunit ribosomal protein S11e
VTGCFKSKEKKAPGKSGHRFYKTVGLGFKTPKDAIEGAGPASGGDGASGGRMQLAEASPRGPAGHYVDKKCPFTGNVSIRGRLLSGKPPGGFPTASQSHSPALPQTISTK